MPKRDVGVGLVPARYTLCLEGGGYRQFKILPVEGIIKNYAGEGLHKIPEGVPE